MKKIISLFCTITLLMSSVSVYANSTTTSMGIVRSGLRANIGIVTEEGQLIMWGNNEYGEFGVDATAPVGLHGFTESIKGVVAVACGYDSTAVVKTDGTLWVCGRNDCGQLGNGTLENSSQFIQMDTNVVKVGAGNGYFIYLKKDGSLWGVGDHAGRTLLNIIESPRVTKPIKIMTGIKDFSTYSRNTAVINTENELYMFGANIFGQLGIGNTEDCNDLTLPVKVLDNVRSVSCGVDYVLAVKYDNTLYSWGKNDCCQLMNGQTSYDNDYVPVYTPTKVAENVLKACAGYDDSGYITTDHKLYMTGESLYGQAGFEPIGTITVPVLVAENVADVAISEHTIYTTLDGKTYIAGHDINGGAGDAYNGFKERPIAVAAQYDFSNLLNIGEDKKDAPISDVNKDVTVEKAKQPMTVKAKTVKVKYKKLKKKKMVVKAITVKNAQGTVSYAKVKKGSFAKLSINKKTGKITVKKGTKKGNYKIVVKVNAKGNAKYLKGSKILKVKVKVK